MIGIVSKLGGPATLAARGLAMALATSVLAACDPADAPNGSETDAPTIVSLNPCLDAILVEVAEPEQVLALSHYSRDPSASSMEVEHAKQFGVTGGSAEEVLALQPDIVLASSFIAPSKRAAFERLGLQVETFGSPVTVEESVAQIRKLAQLTNSESAGEDLIERIKRSHPSPRETHAVSTLLWQPGQIVPGEATLISELLREGGFINQAQERGLTQGDHVSLETVLAAPPELLLVAGGSAGQRHPMLSRLSDTRVETLDTRLLYCGGPTIIAVRERLQAILERMADD